MFGDRIIYLQLQKSISRFLFSRYYPYNKADLNLKLLAFYSNGVQMEDDSIHVYVSKKVRKLAWIKWLCLEDLDDLYSAQITFTKSD